jgi:hypothetical protein
MLDTYAGMQQLGGWMGLAALLILIYLIITK